MVRDCVIVWPKKPITETSVFQYFGQNTGLMKIQALKEESSYAPSNPYIAPEAAADAQGRETGTAIDINHAEGAHSRLWKN